MDLFTLAAAKSVKGSANIPSCLFRYHSFIDDPNGNGYLWDNTSENDQSSLIIPIYVTNQETYIPICFGNGEAHYQCVDTSTGECHYKIFAFGSNGSNDIELIDEKIYALWTEHKKLLTSDGKIFKTSDGEMFKVQI